MTTFRDAQKAVERFVEELNLEPDEPISIACERHEGGWVIVVSMPPGYDGPRANSWPTSVDGILLRVEYNPLPQITMG